MHVKCSLFNDKPYKEDNESFPEPLILCPGHVPSQAGGQNGQLTTYGLSVTLVFICYVTQAMMSKFWINQKPFCAWMCQSRISHGSYPSHCGQHLRKAAVPPWQLRLKNCVKLLFQFTADIIWNLAVAATPPWQFRLKNFVQLLFQFTADIIWTLAVEAALPWQFTLTATSF